MRNTFDSVWIFQAGQRLLARSARRSSLVPFGALGRGVAYAVMRREDWAREAIGCVRATRVKRASFLPGGGHASLQWYDQLVLDRAIVDMLLVGVQWFLTTRLVTRTKESGPMASGCDLKLTYH